MAVGGFFRSNADQVRALRRLAAVVRAPLWHEALGLQRRRAIEEAQLWRFPPVDAAGLPVLVVGGMGSTPLLLSPLRDVLLRLNCRVNVPSIGLGVGCGEVTTRTIERALVTLVEATNQRAIVIAHSRGGQFARALAVRNPDLVRGLITLGSPLTRMFAVHPLLRVQVAALGIAGALGVPGLVRPSCLWGACCAGLRADLHAPFPDAVPFLSVYSPSDRVVDWRSCQDPAARCHAVDTSHGGLLWHPDSLTVIAEELAHALRQPQPSPATAHSTEYEGRVHEGGGVEDRRRSVA